MAMATTAEGIRAHSGPAILSYCFRLAAAWVAAFGGFVVSFGALLLKPRAHS